MHCGAAEVTTNLQSCHNRSYCHLDVSCMTGNRSSHFAICFAVALTLVTAVLASTTWTTVPSANTGDTNFLYSVAGTLSTDIWTVGYAWKNNVQANLAEHWDGTSWRTFPTPNPGTVTKCAAGYSG